MADNLRIYLNDHLAGANAAVELLDRLKGDDNAPAHIVALATSLRDEVSADRAILVDLMARLEIPESGMRRAAGWFGEKVAVLKTSIDDPLDRGLRVFELLEALALGIEGKRALWTVLRAASDANAEIATLNFVHLLQRVDEQRGLIERHRILAGVAALFE